MITRREFIAQGAATLALSGCAGERHIPNIAEPISPPESNSMPIISGLTYAVTDTTIVASWTTDVSADSNLSAGGKAAIDNGVAAPGTAHMAIVTGLSPNTLYSCFVTSGGTSSTPQNVTTASPATRIFPRSAVIGTPIRLTTANGDTFPNVVGSDGNLYSLHGDTTIPGPSANVALEKITNEITFAMTRINSFTAYGIAGANDGADGPAGSALSNKAEGLFAMGGSLFMFQFRQHDVWPYLSYNGNIARSNDFGATWNNWTSPSTFSANPASPIGIPMVGTVPSNFAAMTPVRYAVDDGSNGYNTAGNGIDGANGFVYVMLVDGPTINGNGLWLMRVPRIQIFAQTNTAFQWWDGPSSPTPADFVNDSNWTNSFAGAKYIYSAANQTSAPDMVFLPAYNCYILQEFYQPIANTPSDEIWKIYVGLTPAGPWTLLAQREFSPSGFYYPMFFHRDVAANTSTRNVPLQLSCTSNYIVDYNPSTSTLFLDPMIQIVSYGFTTVENPLSNGGTFTTGPTYNACQVPSSGVCEATVVSANSVDYWSGAVPPGDTGGTWPNDQYAEVTVGAVALPGTDALYAIVRQATAANTLYLLQINGTTSAPAATNSALFAFVAGVLHSLVTTISMTIAAGDVIRLSVTGNVLTVTQNGTTTQTFTDTNNFVPGPGAPALGVLSSVLAASFISNFAAGANQAAAPTFNPPGGSFSAPQTVMLTGPGGSTIFYTLDGSTPTRSSSSVASGGTVSITPPKTLKAISSASNFADSTIATANFTQSGAAGDLGPGFDFKYRM